MADFSKAMYMPVSVISADNYIVYGVFASNPGTLVVSPGPSSIPFDFHCLGSDLAAWVETPAEITLFDGYIVVYKFVHDLHFFVTAGDDENELILASVLHGFSDSVGLLLRGDVEKRTALENLDLILLCIDEIVDGGIILETDANTIAGKVATNAVDGSVPFSEQTISQALATAREHLARSLLK
ncbi:Coatomer subunit zeta-2 [Zea mays]|uniref:Coatomer subunit zeta n=1 Tax=Zea mays TaxID=4577 RepID=A0A1D6I667_MAIZE|nr:Coatomer subunit zeta-2 [Zea mays]ONM55585.1 Coatomer subunit zeta-2 [Zea mays]